MHAAAAAVVTPALSRLLARLARETDACPEEGSVPAVEVRALLILLEAQARAALEEVARE